ncbi:MAG: flagellin, partial [Parvularcula sp.]|nr:flagellin [Parvularcula sp.]
LRNVQSNLQETQDRISTGLKVRSPKENPAFFLVSQTVKGDVAVLDGLKDNLTIGVNTAKTASAGLNGITEDINQIQTALTTAQTGTALNEVQFAINEVVGQIEGQINATSFNGVNLLAGNETTTITTTITRDNGSFELSTFTLQGQDLDSQELAAVAQGIYTQAQAELQFDALYRAFNPGLGDRLDVNGDGEVEMDNTAANTDSVLTAEGGTEAAGAFTFYGNQSDIDFLRSVGVTATNLGKVGNDITKDVIEIANINFSPSNSASPSPTQAPDDIFEAIEINNDTPFTSIELMMQEVVFSDVQLRAFADASGFRAVARQISVNDEVNGNVEAGFVLADSLIARINIAATVVGVFEATLSSRQDFLSDLTDSLELGVAALTEADLNEESSRLQSFQVQEQLAVQALSIANQRPQTLLSLFR